MEEEEKFGVIGCMTLLGTLVALGFGIYWASSNGLFDRKAPEAQTPLTQVAPVKEKTVVKQAADIPPLAEKIKVGDESPDLPTHPGVTASVDNLGAVTSLPPEVQSLTEAAEIVLKNDALCYENRRPRRTVSLFDDTHGFAVTFGADTLNDGNPYPRLEVFINPTMRPPFASYLSMTEKPVPGFSDREEPVAYSENSITELIARWVAAVATERCPAPATSAPAAGSP